MAKFDYTLNNQVVRRAHYTNEMFNQTVRNKENIGFNVAFFVNDVNFRPIPDFEKVARFELIQTLGNFQYEHDTIFNKMFEKWPTYGNVSYVKHEVRKCTPDDFAKTFFPILDNSRAYAAAIRSGSIYCPADPAKLKLLGNGVSNVYSFLTLNLVECNQTNASDCFDNDTRQKILQ